MIQFFLNRGKKVKGLFIDYGQIASKREKKAVKAICKFYSIELDLVKLNLNQQFGHGEVSGRNLMLLSTALCYFPFDSGVIALGIHSGTEYSDCSNSFIQSTQQVFDIYKDGRIKIEAPFINMQKKEIWQYGIENKIPLNLTYSCEMGKIPACGECLSCKDKVFLYETS